MTGTATMMRGSGDDRPGDVAGDDHGDQWCRRMSDMSCRLRIEKNVPSLKW